jgi:hypothetical protein
VLAAADERNETSVSLSASDLMGGEWDRLVVVCRGATEGELAEEIGQYVPQELQVNSTAFGAAWIFMNDDEIVEIGGIGSGSEWYYSLCPVPRIEAPPFVISIKFESDTLLPLYAFELPTHERRWATRLTDLQSLATGGST